VLINLGSWDNQLRGLKECARVLKPGGLLLLSEATVQGWHKLNDLRREWAMPEIPMPPFNNYLDQDRVVEGAAPELEKVDIVNFSSTYFIGTRIIKPLLAKVAGAGIDVADPDMEWNRWCAMLPAAGDYGTQKLFVLRKVGAS
jgi:SAM-dependent methyltransferase